MRRLQRLKLWWKQYWCEHAHYIEDIERVSENEVKCSCFICGEVHHAPYGLALMKHGSLVYRREYGPEAKRGAR